MLSHEAKQALDDAISLIGNEGCTIYGFVLSPNADSLQPFGNSGDEVSHWFHNIETAVAVFKDQFTQAKEA